MQIEIKFDGYRPVIIDTAVAKQTIEIPGYDEARLILDASELLDLKPGEGHDAVCVEYEHVDTDEDDGDLPVRPLSGTLYAACEFGEIEGVRIPRSLRIRLHALREACAQWETAQRARIAAEPPPAPSTRRLPTPAELRAYDTALDAYSALVEKALWDWSEKHGGTLPTGGEHLAELPAPPTPSWL